ncbi:MAG: hypothetical protein KAW12_29120 [Candidatus Aminicenantes bacterium]|nr:hypothetical protein [Candidatus Aminicenantes bacterium]
MKTFSCFLILEFKRLFSKKNIILFLIFLLLALYFVQEGTHDYKAVIESKENFQEVERINIGKFINYAQYAFFGFRVKFIPSPLSIFFSNSGVVAELTAFVDSGVRLRIYSSFLGKNLYSERSGSFKDFFGIILLFGSLLCLFIGYDCLRHREYLKFLASILNYRKVYFSLFFSRLLLLNIFFLFIVGCALGLIKLNGISLSSAEYLFLGGYCALMALLSLFFASLGVLAGSIKSRSLGTAMIMALWFALIFLIPGAITRIVARKADNITSAYNLEQKKLNLLSAFEKRALNEAQRYTNLKEKEESEKELVESYWDNELAKIQALEKKMQDDMEDSLKYFQGLSLFFPSTFLLSVNNEISSRGYENFLDFYRYIQQLQRQFIRFYLNKRYYSNYKKIESFVKADENIYHGKTRLPRNFPAGLLLTAFYVGILSFVSYYRFKRFLFVLQDKAVLDPGKLALDLNKGETVVLLTTAATIIDQLYNVFSGIKRGFNGRVKVNGDNIVPGSGSGSGKEGFDFVYVCHPDKIPGHIDVRDFLSFVKRLPRISPPKGEDILEIMEKMAIGKRKRKNFSELKDHEKGRILLAAARLKGSRIYMIHDIARGMPMDFIVEFKKQAEKLKASGAAILYFSNDVLLAAKIGNRVTYLLSDPSVPRGLDNYTAL